MQADTLKASFNGIDDLKAALDERAILAITGPQGGFNCSFDTFCSISNDSRKELPGRKHHIFNPGHHPNEFFRSCGTSSHADRTRVVKLETIRGAIRLIECMRPSFHSSRHFLFHHRKRKQTMNETNEIEILLVEDSQDDLDMTLRSLRKANFANRIEIARDGAEALEFIFCEGAHVGRKIENTPKMILLDLKLPKVDGMEVLKRIKGDPRTKAIPVVILTSSKEQRDVVESYHLGVNSYIVKPVNFEGFAAAIKELGMYWLLLNQAPKV